ncbi:MAG: sulfate/thiosulfate transport system substrate-binding protein [Solirubrobacteraceae bacterium]|jgi:sulfate transport system substrate-binding protein|nr:sulfate/thiosulfate transport system substrate-binding protein [Solirubrobacteraceae bacterium]
MPTRHILALTLALATLGLAACGGSSGDSGGESKHVALVAYSTPQAAFGELIGAFQQTSAGKGVSFTQSYGPSGEQSRAVSNGLHADVVNFSLEPDVERLVKSGMVAQDWNKNATHGFVTNTVAVFIVRKGNPKHITTWSDLTKKGVQVLTPNPYTSGSARWNVLAAYGAAIHEGKTESQAQAYLTSLFHNVVSQDSSARNALQTFLAGRGDVLIDYESEAIADQKKSGGQIEYVIPPSTILIQNPAAVVGSSATAKKFVEYLVSPAAQQIWVAHGYRPVIGGVPGASKLPTPQKLFTTDSLGGWKVLAKRFFDPESGLVTKIEQSLGVSTSK